MEKLKRRANARLNFFRLPKYKKTEFLGLREDINSIGNMGRVLDKSLS
jgi:hypothetical protein